MERLPAATPGAATLVGSAVIVCLLVVNAKGLPFVHSIRLLPSLYRLLRPRLFSSRKGVPERASAASTPAATAEAPLAARPGLFQHHITRSRAVLSDLDVNIHKSNSTFFADADINRAELLTRRLIGGLVGAVPLLAAVQCTFKREIGPFQAYDLSSRVLCWDEKSLFIVTYFLKPRTALPPDVELAGGPAAALQDASLRRTIYAVMVTRYVCKSKGRKTVAPASVLKHAGLLVKAVGTPGVDKADPLDAQLLAPSAVETAVKAGMEYVRDCMV
ncbi:hypothetical protein VTJ83DRAFT_4653 [Remersonia thermophila]|uniref:Uncharacterized protein n=1 Tax=Remersonia thermophila TaxID=72144 RepID=A0ABR4DAK8_9PEZI